VKTNLIHIVNRTLFGDGHDTVGDAHSLVYHEQLQVIKEQASSNVRKNQKNAE